MTDTPDTYGRRGAAAGIADMHHTPMHPRRIEPTLDGHAERIQGLSDAMKRAAAPPLQPATAPEPPAELTYLESIAKRVLYLPYGDMKELAADAMGEQECKTPADFADRLHEWAKRVEAKAIGGGA